MFPTWSGKFSLTQCGDSATFQCIDKLFTYYNKIKNAVKLSHKNIRRPNCNNSLDIIHMLNFMKSCNNCSKDSLAKCSENNHPVTNFINDLFYTISNFKVIMQTLQTLQTGKTEEDIFEVCRV